MLFKWEIEALWGGGFKSVELDPLTIWNIFYYFFRNFIHGDSDEKVDLGNKERPNIDRYIIIFERARGLRPAFALNAIVVVRLSIIVRAEQGTRKSHDR